APRSHRFQRSALSPPFLRIELDVRPDSARFGMTASEMMVINPPWKLEQQMNNVLPWLQKVLVPSGTGYHKVSWIVPE
ncbi:23S rRNA (adenine(2030)-N(6))-methyltransferase RlmJ, partial [Candidatus Erwinia dacicola]|uniref:23S rRNA (adenine(2030)-N(6))-methyltransferase RlmJ n=1 Tax=Candidatus Erwinia dacicola TaxID=252393 RepID=UPI001392495B